MEILKGSVELLKSVNEKNLYSRTAVEGQGPSYCVRGHAGNLPEKLRHFERHRCIKRGEQVTFGKTLSMCLHLIGGISGKLVK